MKNFVSISGVLHYTHLESWPVKTDSTSIRWGNTIRKEYENALRSAIDTAVMVDEKDRQKVKIAINKKYFDGNLLWDTVDHTIYQVEVEGEVVEQYHWKTDDGRTWMDNNHLNFAKDHTRFNYRKIFRLRAEAEKKKLCSTHCNWPDCTYDDCAVKKDEGEKPTGELAEFIVPEKEPDWEKLSKIEPPKDYSNAPLRGAWLEGQMVGYAQARIHCEADARYWKREYFKLQYPKVNQEGGKDVNPFFKNLPGSGHGV